MTLQEDTVPTIFDMRPGTREVIELISEKWRVLIIYAIASDVKRHSELKRQIKGISQKMLTQTLRNLERDGMIVRTVVRNAPLHIEYSLTPLGETFSELIQDICTWADQHYDEISRANRHYHQ